MLTLLYAAAVFLVPRPAEVIINATVPTVAAISVFGKKWGKKKDSGFMSKVENSTVSQEDAYAQL